MVAQRLDDEQVSVALEEHPELQADAGFIDAATQLAKPQTAMDMRASESGRQLPED